MATQYDPIAKDESLHTTELNPRNITDVLASGMASIVSALTPGELEDLSDVTISSPTDGQVLKYDSATQKWVNGAGGGGSAGNWIADNGMNYRKIGDIIEFYLEKNMNLGAGWNNVGTLPEEYRPQIQFDTLCFYESGGSYTPKALQIKIDGIVRIYSNGGGNQLMFCHEMYSV